MKKIIISLILCIASDMVVIFIEDINLHSFIFWLSVVNIVLVIGMVSLFEKELQHQSYLFTDEIQAVRGIERQQWYRWEITLLNLIAKKDFGMFQSQETMVIKVLDRMGEADRYGEAFQAFLLQFKSWAVLSLLQEKTYRQLQMSVAEMGIDDPQHSSFVTLYASRITSQLITIQKEIIKEYGAEIRAIIRNDLEDMTKSQLDGEYEVTLLLEPTHLFRLLKIEEMIEEIAKDAR